MSIFLDLDVVIGLLTFIFGLFFLVYYIIQFSKKIKNASTLRYDYISLISSLLLAALVVIGGISSIHNTLLLEELAVLLSSIVASYMLFSIIIDYTCEKK